jgi:hypothetical protein
MGQPVHPQPPPVFQMSAKPYMEQVDEKTKPKVIASNPDIVFRRPPSVSVIEESSPRLTRVDEQVRDVGLIETPIARRTRSHD